MKIGGFQFAGGLNVVDPPSKTNAGACRALTNYYVLPAGGYQRALGFERFDGRPLASTATVGVPFTDPTWEGLMRAARTTLRNAITVVPGSGAIRGVFTLKGDVYAFRDNAGATACVLHKATASGWTVVTTPALVAGGKYRFILHNFKGASSSRSIYGCDGKNKAFQFDGTTFTQITTGMGTDTPHAIAQFANHLFLAFPNGSLQNSPVGDPTAAWTLRTGAGEFGVGDDITDLKVMRGEVLAVLCRYSSKLLYGNSAANWTLKTFSESVGCADGTAVEVGGQTMFMDGPRLVAMQTTAAFADFEPLILSRNAQKLYDGGTPNLAYGSPSKGHVRVQFAGKKWLVASFYGGELIGLSKLLYPVEFECAFVGEDAAGTERIVAGDKSLGYVYILDSGDSFDGATITSNLLTVPYNAGGWGVKKRWYRARVELQTPMEFPLYVSQRFNYGRADSNPQQLLEVNPGGGVWDISLWNQFVWSAGDVGTADFYMDGTAEDVALLLYSTTDVQPTYTLDLMQIFYDVRGVRR